MSRREFLTGGTAALSAAAWPRQVEADAPEKSIQPEARPTAESEADFYERFADTFTSFNEMMIVRAETFISVLETALPFGFKETVGDEKLRTRVEYLRTALQLSNFDPIAAAELRKQLPAKALVESEWDASKESSAGARGILQFMPGTWAEHARSEEANILSLVEQVYATDSLLEQIRATLENRHHADLATVKTMFFADDDESFIRDFYVPVVQSCFNAGAGNLGTVLSNFAGEFTSEHDRNEKLAVHGLHPEGKDVYALMTQLEREKDWDPQYGRQSIGYVYKIYGARLAIDTVLPEGARAMLLGELPDGRHPAVDGVEYAEKEIGE